MFRSSPPPPSSVLARSAVPSDQIRGLRRPKITELGVVRVDMPYLRAPYTNLGDGEFSAFVQAHGCMPFGTFECASCAVRIWDVGFVNPHSGCIACAGCMQDSLAYHYANPGIPISCLRGNCRVCRVSQNHMDRSCGGAKELYKRLITQDDIGIIAHGVLCSSVSPYKVPEKPIRIDPKLFKDADGLMDSGAVARALKAQASAAAAPAPAPATAAAAAPVVAAAAPAPALAPVAPSPPPEHAEPAIVDSPASHASPTLPPRMKVCQDCPQHAPSKSEPPTPWFGAGAAAPPTPATPSAARPQHGIATVSAAPAPAPPSASAFKPSPPRAATAVAGLFGPHSGPKFGPPRASVSPVFDDDEKDEVEIQDLRGLSDEQLKQHLAKDGIYLVSHTRPAASAAAAAAPPPPLRNDLAEGASASPNKKRRRPRTDVTELLFDMLPHDSTVTKAEIAKDPESWRLAITLEARRRD